MLLLVLNVYAIYSFVTLAMQTEGSGCAFPESSDKKQKSESQGYHHVMKVWCIGSGVVKLCTIFFWGGIFGKFCGEFPEKFGA